MRNVGWLYYKLGVWDRSLIKDAMFWFVGTGFVHLLNINDFMTDASQFKKVFWNSVKLIGVLEFIINVYTFSFLVELILMSTILFLVALSTVAETDEQFELAKKVVDSILTMIMLFLIGFSLINIVNDFNHFASAENLHAFLLPIWLTVGYLCFVYFLALYAAYESFFVLLCVTLEQKNEELAKYAKRKTLIFCNINLARFIKFTSKRAKFLKLRTKEDMDALINDFKNQQKLGVAPGD